MDEDINKREDAAKEAVDIATSKYWGPVARAWCRPECVQKVVDVELASGIVHQLIEELGD